MLHCLNPQKRLCNGAGVCVQVEQGGMVTDSMQQQGVPNSGVGINHPASDMVDMRIQLFWKIYIYIFCIFIYFGYFCCYSLGL